MSRIFSSTWWADFFIGTQRAASLMVIAAACAATVAVPLSCLPPRGPSLPPAPPAPPPPAADPVRATVRLRFGSSGCSACLTDLKDSTGRTIVITAAHCTGNVGARGEIRLKDERTFPVEVVVRNRAADVSIMVTTTTETLPFARVAAMNAPVGTQLWHVGYGVDRPGNRETGTIRQAESGEGQCGMVMSFSSGDSGSPIFREDSGEQVSVVCCTSGRNGYGANVSAIRAALEQAIKRAHDLPDWEWKPQPIPECQVSLLRLGELLAVAGDDQVGRSAGHFNRRYPGQPQFVAFDGDRGRQFSTRERR